MKNMNEKPHELRVEIFAGAEMPDPSARDVSTMWMQTFVGKMDTEKAFFGTLENAILAENVDFVLRKW